jgi:uncharacterized protein YjbI with pentapeptide repeats
VILRAYTIVALSLLCFPSAAFAFADCSAVPAPGVDWSRCFLEESNFTDGDLTNAVLVDTRFQRADLSRTLFDGADIRDAKFVDADLVGASFIGANLRKADMTKANLEGANLSQANLRRTRLFRANLRGANFTGARLDQTDLHNADLSGATWTDGERVCAEGSIGRCK